MFQVLELEENYSTTRRVIKADSQAIAGLVKQATKPGDKFETVLFLPEGEGRQGEGGLRTKGYFKVGGIIPSPLTPNPSPEAKPLITVVTVVYNGEKFLEETILSVINQTYDNVEYIIIDGGSTDGTLDIIKKYEHAIDYWVSEKDKGIYDAMNKGIDLANAEWINFMNAGDRFSEDSILDQVMIQTEKFDVLYSDTLFEYESGTTLFKCSKEKMKLIHQSLIYKKELHNLFGVKYLVKSGFTSSDYLFFWLISELRWLKIPKPISVYNPYGVSSGLKTFRNKLIIDYLFGRQLFLLMALKILVHPFYNFFKKIILVVFRLRW